MLIPKGDLVCGYYRTDNDLKKLILLTTDIAGIAMYKIAFLLLFVVAFASCKKKDVIIIPIGTATNTTDSAQYGTPFTGVPDTKDIVMYEVNIRAFSATDDFAGIETRMDSIKALGVNVI